MSDLRMASRDNYIISVHVLKKHFDSNNTKCKVICQVITLHLTVFKMFVCDSYLPQGPNSVYIQSKRGKIQSIRKTCENKFDSRFNVDEVLSMDSILEKG